MVLFKPSWQSRDTDRALKAVRSMTNQTTLAKVVRDNDARLDIRLAAVDKLEDQSVLVELVESIDAMDDRGDLWRVAAAAFEKIDSQDVLRRFATNAQASCGRRIAAAERITDKEQAQRVFTVLARDPEIHVWCRLDAAKAIEDKALRQEMLVNLARTPDPYSAQVRVDAACSLDDAALAQAELAEIATTGDAHVGMLAISKLTDQRVLLDVVRSEGSPIGVRKAAIHAMTDVSLLTAIIDGNPDEYSYTWQQEVEDQFGRYDEMVHSDLRDDARRRLTYL